MTDTALARYEKRAELPLVGGAVVFLVVYAWPILDPGLDPAVRRACQIVNVIVWIGFAADYLIRLRLSVNRRRYVRVYWFDLVILALPMFRPLRALRAVLALSILNRSATPLSRGRVVAFVSLAVVIVMGVAGLAMLDAERHAAGSRITSYGDALWWAVSTVTTVGYGDKTPVTTQGRLIAVALMVTGIALLGVVTAALASWFVEHFREVEAAEVRTETSLAELAAQVAALRDELRRALAPAAGDATHGPDD